MAPILFRLGISTAYASIFPITNLLGGGIATLGIFISAPFLPISWIVGMLFVFWFGAGSAFLAGAFFAIVFSLWHSSIYWLGLDGSLVVIILAGVGFVFTD